MIDDARRISRRSFLIAAAATGGGLALGVGPFEDAAAATKAEDASEMNAWLVIRPDDTVVVRMAYTELGQGSITGLAQLVAEELECDWNKVTWEYPTPGTHLARGKVFVDMETGGSKSIVTSQEHLRKAGAAARAMLVQAAANAWNVPATECTVEKGVISHRTLGRRTTYGKVAAAAARLDVAKDVPLKDPKDWTIIGKSLKRLDTADKLTGKQVYSTDLKLPGMLNAAIKACPVFGGKVKRLDPASAERMPGVKKIVRVEDYAIAVVADTWWHAKTALEAIRVEWDAGDSGKVSSASIDARLSEGLEAKDAFIGVKTGDSKAALAGSSKRIEAIYDYPFQAHACMEPMNATALFSRERCEVWCPTQDPAKALATVAEAADLPIAHCEVHRLAPGGGFGRRLFMEHITQAVLIAREMPGSPVKLLWSREEDIARARYHPVTKAKLTGGLDASSNLAGLEVRLCGPSILADVEPKELEDGKDMATFIGYYVPGENNALQYDIANLTMDHAMRNTHVPVGWWRGVSGNQNALFLECFIDELAHAAGRDPLAFRQQLMANHPKALAVLNAVAEKGGWSGKAPPGRHRGLAQSQRDGSYVAALAEISVADGDKIKVHRMVFGIDPGYAVNPAQIERQIAGSVVFGLSALFLQECTVKSGAIEQENFDSYDSMRIAQMPKVEAIVMPSGGRWGGVGEAICVAAPAVMNAFFAATGRRIRSFPLKKHEIRLV